MATSDSDCQRPRIDWYQTDAYVSVSIFVKGVAPATALGVVGNDGRSVAVTYELPDAASAAAAGDVEQRLHRRVDLQLAHPVAAEGLQLSVKAARLDLRLNKLQAGVRWAALEGQVDSAAPAPAAPTASAAAVAAAAEPPNPQLHMAKNWDAIAKSIDDDKLEGDAALNDLFQKIYSDGSDEQRKAMVKSFTESGGTVLSTNWGDVAKGTVDVKPPDGMEYKKWDS